MERVASLVNEESSSEDIEETINEISDWLSERSTDDNFTQASVRYASSVRFLLLILRFQDKCLRAALNILCRHHLDTGSGFELATARAMEESLRAQIERERESTLAVQNRLQAQLDAVCGDLRAEQAERRRSSAETLAAQENWNQIREELRNSLRMAVSHIQSLRSENEGMLAQLQTLQGKYKLL